MKTVDCLRVAETMIKAAEKDATTLNVEPGTCERLRNMTESKLRSIPHFASLDELVEFFETHDLGEYWEQIPEAHFEVDIKRRTHLFALDEEIADKLTEIA